MAEDERHQATAGLSTESDRMDVDTPAPTPTPEAEAGPSRVRRSSPYTDPMSADPPPRPSSPSTTLPNPDSNGDASASQSTIATDEEATPPRSTLPHLDLATYPTQQLLRLLASLLQQIASANDQLRPESNEDGDEEGMGNDDQSTSSGTRSRADSRASNTPHSSTTPNPASGQVQGNAQAQSLVNPNLNPGHPSPTTALFTDGEAPPSSSSLKPADPTRRQSTSPTTGRPENLFTASKTSLNHRSSLLSFHARHIPSISIEAYLLRILKYCPTTNEVFLGLLVYFDRMSRLGTPGGLGGMMKGGKGLAIDSYNVHRLVIAGVTVASKFFSGMSSSLSCLFVLNPKLTTRCVLHKLALRESRRSTTSRTQSTRTPIPSPKRFQAGHPIRRDAAIWEPFTGVLGE